MNERNSLFRGVLLSLALGALASTSQADDERANKMVQLTSTHPIVGGNTTYSVRSPLIGATVSILADSSINPSVLAHPTLPVLCLGNTALPVAAGTIGPDGRFQATIATSPVLQSVFFQAVVVQGPSSFASNCIRLVPGAITPNTFSNGSSGLPTSVSSFSGDVDFADLNKDGCLDAVVLGGTPRILIGDCNGGFQDRTSALLPVVAQRSTSVVAIGDVDGDSWPDLFLGGGPDVNAPAPNVIVLNNRRGGFIVPSLLPFIPQPTVRDMPRLRPPGFIARGKGIASSAEFGDIDGDGDLDLLVTNGPDDDHPSETPDPATLYRNMGGAQGGFMGGFRREGSFGQIPTVQGHGGGSGTAIFGDADNDGDLDIFLCGSNLAAGGQQPALFANDGNGAFIDVTQVALPVTADHAFDALFGDFDLDGDLDIFVANSISSDPFAMHLFENVTTTPGQPRFVDGSTNVPVSLGNTTNVRLNVDAADIDLDGDLDILVGIHELPGGMGTSGYATLLRNNGGMQGGTTGVFVVDSSFLPGLFIEADVAFGDVDNDGDPDLYLSNSGRLFGGTFQDELWINNF